MRQVLYEQSIISEEKKVESIATVFVKAIGKIAARGRKVVHGIPVIYSDADVSAAHDTICPACS